MPKYRVVFPIEIRVRIRHGLVVEAEDEELARAIAAIKVRRIKGQPNLFSYVCPHRDEDMRDFQVLADKIDPFSGVSSALCSCEEVKND